MPAERSAEMFADLVVPSDSAGVDEVGRGPLAGPVVAGAVMLPAGHGIAGLRDSKRLSAKQREALATEIKAAASGWAIGIAHVAEIDAINILQASHLAMQRAVADLLQQPSLVLVDGNQLPSFAVPAVAVVKGDARVAQISAAAILAKVERDGMMAAMDQQHPQYGFAQHKGYATAAHLAALAQHGPCSEHRYSFAPVRAAAPAAVPSTAPESVALVGASSAPQPSITAPLFEVPA